MSTYQLFENKWSKKFYKKMRNLEKIFVSLLLARWLIKLEIEKDIQLIYI